ncbi:MAG TPA: DUF86 domain-containing protein [Chloroflexia bacterium]|jgi:uncharacterized protein with HEPN domain
MGDYLYLKHILDAIEKIGSYTLVGKKAFMDQSHWQDATIRQLEILGEATKNLSEGLRSRYRDIPWRRIAGLRDVLIHNYMGVDLEAVWKVTQDEVPNLKKRVEAILTEIDIN